MKFKFRNDFCVRSRIDYKNSNSIFLAPIEEATL